MGGQDEIDIYREREEERGRGREREKEREERIEERDGWSR